MKYQWDGEAVPLSSSPPTFLVGGSPCHGCDCSGAMRWVVYHATFGQVDIADGSYTQGEFLAECGLKQTNPANGALRDGRLRILCITRTDRRHRPCLGDPQRRDVREVRRTRPRTPALGYQAVQRTHA